MSGDDERALTTALERLMRRRLPRRGLLKSALVGAAGAWTAVAQSAAAPPESPTSASTLGFTEIAHGLDATHHLPPSYTAQMLLRSGDPLFPDAPRYVPGQPDPEGQERQFGCDNDFLAFFPLDAASGAQRGLLCANHERSTMQLLWPGITMQNAQTRATAAQCAHEMSSQGVSIVEVRQEAGRWRTVRDSPYNRRISARSGIMAIGGPAAGHARLRTQADRDAQRVVGTFNNCAGGVTPWGTLLTCEENFHFYFTGDPTTHAEAAALERYRFDGRPIYAWGRHVDRFDLQKEPNEPNRYGWVVEIDPYDPASMPVKRTALGRFKHEGATTAISHDGRVAVYMGDDERFEYLYKFVSEGKYLPGNRAANRKLLDRGTLYVARFESTERMRWLPLTHGTGPLTAANGFHSQADIVIEARRAADLLGATSMDRPEDVEPHPHTGHIYVVLTNNSRRTATQTNPANPRAQNRWGQILEIVPPRVGGQPDHTATECTWEFFLLAGDPAEARHSARYAGPVSRNGWLACPDNIAFDAKGRIWIATDGQDDAAGCADSVYAADTSGPGRGITKLFFNAPRGAEVCGPCFSPDGRTLFVAIQHPGDESGSSYQQPSTRWPDFAPGVPPRSAVLAITRTDGGEIGS